MKLPDKVVYSPPSPPLSLSSSELAPPPSSVLPSLSSSSPPQAQPDHILTPPPASDSSPAVSQPPPPFPDSATNASSSPSPSCPLPDFYYSPSESVAPPPLLPEFPPPDIESPPLATFYPSPPPPSLPLSPPPPQSISPPPPASLSPPSSFLYASPPPPVSTPPPLVSPEPALSPPPPTLSPPVPQSPLPRAPPLPPETPSLPFHSPPSSHKTHSTAYVPPPKVHKSPPYLPSAVKPSPQKVLGVTTSTVATVAVVSGLVMLTFLGAAAWVVKKNKKSFEPSGQGGSGSVAAVTGSSQSHVSETTYPSSTSYPLVRHNTSGSYARYTSGSYGFPNSPSEAGLGIMKLWFTLEELSEITNGFSNQNLLGEGGFGSVYKGCLRDGRLVAVKQLKVGGKQGEREFQAEVETISRVHHRHLVSLVGYCTSENNRLLVYDYAPNNTLYYHLHEKASRVMGWTTRVKVAAGAARGIAYLHEDCHPRIIHRDIKSSNILLDNNYEAQVSDFGLARSALDSNTHVTTRVMGTFGYLAPEYASSGKLMAKSDVYSFGVVILELITGRKPVDSSQPLGDESLVEWARPLLIQALETGDLGVLPDPRLEGNYLEEEMLHMIETAAACVRHSSSMRPRMGQVVRVLDSLAESNDITNGIRPGQSEIFESSPKTEEIRIFQKREFGYLDDSSSEYTRSNWKRRTDL